jgi:hypothetical protein
MLGIVQDCIRRRNRIAGKLDVLSRIEIAIEAGEVTARNLQNNRQPYFSLPPAT